jgi:hypothetical protein
MNKRKQITLKIKPDKYRFFIELIANFDFVSIVHQSPNKNVTERILKGMKEAELAAKGKITTNSARQFIKVLKVKKILWHITRGLP